MKKIVWILLILFTVIGCGRVKDGGADVYGTNTGYDPYNGGAFIYYGKAFSGTVEVVDPRSNQYDPKIVGEYTVDKGLYISEFKKNATDASKEVWYSGKLKYNESTRKYSGTIKLNHDMHGEVKGSWYLTPMKLADGLVKYDSFFGNNITNIIAHSASVEKADIKASYFKLGYRSSAKIRDKHIIEYKLTDTSEDNFYMEYEASKINKDGTFEFKMILYKHSPKQYNYTINNLVKQEEIYKNAKKIIIEGIASYNKFQNGKINYLKLDFDPTTTYTIKDGFKTYYDDMMYIFGNGGVIKPFTMQIFDNPDLYDIIMDRLLISDTKENFNKWLNNNKV